MIRLAKGDYFMKLQSKLSNPDLLRTQSYVNGEWIDAGNQPISVMNPSTGETIATVPALSRSQVQIAIESADIAFRQWSGKSAHERAKILRSWYELILENTEDLATILTTEQGKPLAEAKAEVAYGAGFIGWFSEEARRLYGEVIPAPKPENKIISIRQPIGVTAAITPWNFPIAMITRKCGAALAAGCTSLVKPSELTPFSALAIAYLGEIAGIPKGVLNVLTGYPGEIGPELTESDLVRKISFTGSTGVGKLLLQQSASTVKNVGMELGGNAPFIVFDDANINNSVEGLISSKFRNAGQTCVCANRILVQDGIYDEFVSSFLERTKKLKVGDGFSMDTDIGPLINASAVTKIRGHIDDAKEKGAQVLLDGMPETDDNLFVHPVVISEVDMSMRVATEETFGPVVPIFRFNDEQEAVSIANQTKSGLAAYFFTENLGRSWRVSEALEFGMIGINSGSVSTEVAPFGGVKESGIGREGSHYGIEEYTEIKTLHFAY